MPPYITDSESEIAPPINGTPFETVNLAAFIPTLSDGPSYNEVLKVGKIRGIESFGMMCSEKELCIGDDHNGIIVLPQDTPIGLPAAEVLNIDPVIEINITPNRAECLGVRGIARDLAAAGLGKLKPLQIKKTPGSFKSPIKVEIQCPEACATYVARYIKGSVSAPVPKQFTFTLKFGF